jgi:hypothetical protein
MCGWRVFLLTSQTAKDVFWLGKIAAVLDAAR